MKYTPKFTDPRIQKRVKRAIGFCCGFVSESEPKSISVKLLQDYLGEFKRELAIYLKSVTLICTNHNYSIKDHKSKEYILNRSGIEYLKYMCENPTSKMSLRNWNEQYNMFEINETKDITISHSIPLFSGSHKSVTKITDKRYVEMLFNKEYAAQLITGDFTYNEKSNRLWNDLQSIKKEYKLPLLSRYNYCNHYDIEAAAPTLILQYAKKLGFNKQVPAYEYYLSNKASIRAQLAQQTETNEKTVKVLINALFNGAKLGYNETFALSHLFKHDRAIIEYLKQHQYLSQLRKDIKQVWDHIGQSRIHQYKEHINKQTGEITQRKIAMTSKFKWSIYFELEYTVMRSVRSYMREKSMKYFLEHDGWACNQAIDRDELIRYVYENTGYELKFDYEDISQIRENDECEIQNNVFEINETKDTTTTYSIPLFSGSHKIVTKIVTPNKKALTNAERQKAYRQRKKQK